MLKTIVIFFGLIIGLTVGVHTVLSNGSLLRYLDEHPNSAITPAIEYYVGEGYVLFQELPEATTYFQRVNERYPNSDYAEDSYYSYLQCLDDMTARSRADMILEYQKYLERYPNGKHTGFVQRRIDTYKFGG